MVISSNFNELQGHGTAGSEGWHEFGPDLVLLIEEACGVASALRHLAGNHTDNSNLISGTITGGRSSWFRRAPLGGRVLLAAVRGSM